jgi:dTMP kinase
MNSRGILIVIEGIDRHMNTIQCQRLVTDLINQDRPTKYIKFPDQDHIICKLTGDVTNPKSLHLLNCAHKWEMYSGMVNLLKGGINLVIDSYVYYDLATMVVKGLSMEWCYPPIIGLLKPDILIYLHTDVELVIERNKLSDDFRQYLEKVSFMFKRQLDRSWDIIDGNMPANRIESKIVDLIETKIGTQKFNISTIT